MTTAARPTFEPARGGQGKNEKDLSVISRQYSSRDLPGQTKLKYREYGQGTIDEIRIRNFKRELEERERGKNCNKRLKLHQVPAASLDADDPLDEEDSESSDDDDDDAALLAELNKIKKERDVDIAKREIKRKQEEERVRMENILSGNPLLTHYSMGANEVNRKVRRRWDEDVVFKNCAKTEPERNTKVFINDSVRSEFHKKFMEKYIK
ncbi:spliceosome-associated protein CWC15 homolog [Diorhabda carinulata]|uniref:spliceosome-associated protein CWC15 homolog n=1 Tax=Diorhabda carinulata TaxID=1163345 RepID=UPI0025A0B4D1|nr:spliceosome-associated protein CWC15 homolog [Diorhabda carinulata]